jgi:hypothetical protein
VAENGGFEQPKAEPADLQSDPCGCLGRLLQVFSKGLPNDNYQRLSTLINVARHCLLFRHGQ